MHSMLGSILVLAVLILFQELCIVLRARWVKVVDANLAALALSKVDGSPNSHVVQEPA